MYDDHPIPPVRSGPPRTLAECEAEVRWAYGVGRRTALAGMAAASAAALLPREAEAAYQRPYGPSALWNLPVAGMTVHSNSATLAGKVWNSRPDQPGNINLSFDSYTYPVYDASNKTGDYPVVSRNGWGNLIGTKIPWNTNWKPSTGSDGQVIIVDPATGREWNLWRVSFSNGKVYFDNGNLVRAGIEQNSTPVASYFTKENGFKPSRGCGIQYLAMLVRPQEVAEGEIRHALSMPLKGIHKSLFVAPATKTDGAQFGVADGVPEGQRFALKVADTEIEAWAGSLPVSSAGKQSARVIARALRDYGWIITDNAGAPHLQFEDRRTAAWGQLGLGNLSAGGKEYPRDLLDGLLTRARIYALSSA